MIQFLRKSLNRRGRKFNLLAGLSPIPFFDRLANSRQSFWRITRVKSWCIKQMLIPRASRQALRTRERSFQMQQRFVQVLRYREFLRSGSVGPGGFEMFSAVLKVRQGVLQRSKIKVGR